MVLLPIATSETFFDQHVAVLSKIFFICETLGLVDIIFYGLLMFFPTPGAHRQCHRCMLEWPQHFPFRLQAFSSEAYRWCVARGWCLILSIKVKMGIRKEK